MFILFVPVPAYAMRTHVDPKPSQEPTIITLKDLKHSGIHRPELLDLPFRHKVIWTYSKC